MKITPYSFHTKAQSSTMDFVLSIIIITIAILLAARLLIGLSEPSTFQDVKYQSQKTSGYLLSSGVPDNWTSTDFIRPGLLSDNELNLTKLNYSAGMSYDDIRSRIAGHYQFYTYFKNKTGVVNLSGCGFGSPDVVIDSNCNPTITSQKNLIQVQRIVAYNNTLLTMVVLVWD